METAAPSFGVDVPSLSPWKLSIFRPKELDARRRRETAKILQEEEESDDDMGFGLFDDGPAVGHTFAAVQSKGDLSIAYRVPGLITVPSDGEMHNVTIRNLDLPASLSWVSVPKKDTRVHLTVCNYPLEGEYCLQQGLCRRRSQTIRNIHSSPEKQTFTWMEASSQRPI